MTGATMTIRHTTRRTGLLALALFLGGCSVLGERVPGAAEEGCITRGIPTVVDDECLLPTWVSFGRTAQTRGQSWRDDVLQYMQDDGLRAGLVRAVLLARQGPAEWGQSVTLFERYIPRAPASIQPLLQQWRHEIELRLALQSRLDEQQDLSRQGSSLSDEQRSLIQALEQQNAELKKKLDALKAIEESMNQRQLP